MRRQEIARAATEELQMMAEWLGLGEIEVIARGSLAAEMRATSG
jgi:uncharacterized protein YcaQ